MSTVALPRDTDRKAAMLFGIAFDPLTMAEAVNAIVDAARGRRKGLVVTPNVDHVLMVADDPIVADVYDRAVLRLADGMPIVWVSRLIGGGRRLPERVAGSDLLGEVCHRAAEAGLTVYFAGGRPGVAERAATQLVTLYADLKVVGTDSPPFGFEHDRTQSALLASRISMARPDILFIGVGAPKQELWADAHLDTLDCGPIVCCGAAFDFAAGTARRAPRIARGLGLEWLWRLLHEPRRLWRRYLVRGPRFLGIALRELSRR